MVKNPKIKSIYLFGGNLCLDFTNTVHDRTEHQLRDYLHHILDLIEWAKVRGVVTEAQALELETLVAREPVKADAFFTRAVMLRENLYSLFHKIALDCEITAKDLELLNSSAVQASKYIHLFPSQDGVSEIFLFPDESFEPLLVPVIRDAQELLLQNRRERIKACPTCGWLFHDTTKNGKRRWCSMKICGSNAKALDWYHRHKAN